MVFNALSESGNGCSNSGRFEVERPHLEDLLLLTPSVAQVRVVPNSFLSQVVAFRPAIDGHECK